MRKWWKERKYLVTLLPSNSGLTLALAVISALETLRTIRVTLAQHALLPPLGVCDR